MSSPTSPYLFKDATPDNINIIKKLLKENKYSMFLRKVDREFPDQTIYDLMATDFGHKYEPLYKIKQAKKKAYNLLFNSCYCVLILVLGYCIWIMIS